jgi:hypothetical protein
MGGACCTHGGEEKCIWDLALNTQTQMGRIMLTHILLDLCD